MNITVSCEVNQYRFTEPSYPTYGDFLVIVKPLCTLVSLKVFVGALVEVLFSALSQFFQHCKHTDLSEE